VKNKIFVVVPLELLQEISLELDEKIRERWWAISFGRRATEGGDIKLERLILTQTMVADILKEQGDSCTRRFSRKAAK